MWIISNIEHELPIILNTDEEVRETLETWNNVLLEGEGEVSVITEKFVINDKTLPIMKYLLTWEDYDESNPYAYAYLYNYSKILLEESLKEKENNEPKIVPTTNPLFGENQKVSGQYYALRVRDNQNKLSVQILKYPVIKNIEASQLAIYSTLLNSVEKVQLPCEGIQQTLNLRLNKQANSIALKTRRGPGNILVAGDDFISKLTNIDTKVKGGTIFDTPSTDFVGVINGGIAVYRDISKYVASNVGILTYRGMGAIDGGAFIIEDNGKYYLNTLVTDTDSIANFSDFYKIIELI